MLKMFTRYIFLLFILKAYCFTETSSEPSPDCQKSCGSVAIPYPFGIGPGCSAHDAYSVTCNTSFNPPRPFITNINLEVLEVSLQGTVRINNPLFDSCNNRTDHLVVNFTNTQFTYSTTATRFTAIGCDNVALISGPTNVLGGCISICNVTFQNNTCYGLFCCQINIPPSLKYIKASVESPSIPAVLDWRLSGDCNAFGPLDSSSNTSVCDSRAICSNQSVCACPQGYQGNPYLSGAAGCLDIDECASSSTNDCDYLCLNKPGSYICACMGGDSHNGRPCLKLQENNKMNTILIGRGGPKVSPGWAGAPPGKKIFSAKFRRKSRLHPLDFFVRTR
ncbi:putative EGF-like calcium-binding domain-containing protein [Helianthus debilis subsp. tardiflorus]